MAEPSARRMRWAAAVATTSLLLSGLVATASAAAAPVSADESVTYAAADPDATPTPTPSTEPATTPTPAPTPTPEDTATVPSPTPSPTASEPVPAPAPAPAPEQQTLALVDPTRPVLPVSPITPVLPDQTRLAGTPYDDSVAASRSTFPSGARTVLIASAWTFWDAVTAAGLAGALQAPTLLVGSGAVPDGVQAELRRLAPTTIVVVGSAAAVSDAVVAQLTGITGDVRRLDGGSDYATSQLALGSLPTDVATVYLAGSSSTAGGASLLDIPVAATAASASGAGVLLVDGLSPAVDPATVAAIRRVGASSVVIVGTTATVGSGYEQSLAAEGLTVSRAGASDVNERSVQAAGLAAAGADRLVVAHATVQSDITAGAVAAASARQPFAYAYYACLPDVTAAFAAAQNAGILAVGDTSWIAPPVERGSSCAAEKPTRDALLTDAIVDIARAYGGSYYVSVRELNGAQEVYSLSGGARVEPASMMKLYAAWAALAHIDVGLASPYTLLPGGLYLIDCIAVMIHASDNDCHADIVHWIGGAGMNRMLASAGFTGTSYGNVGAGGSILYAGNRTTTDDLVWFLQRLRAGEMLSPSSTDILLGLMGDQIWRSRIASGIPYGVGQQTKPGSLWLPSGLLQADTGIVYGARSTVALSIVTTGNVDRAALRAITRTVYSHYNGGFGAAASYPVQQMITKVPAIIRDVPAGRAIGTIPAERLTEVTDASRMWYKIRYGASQVWVDFRTLRNR